MNANTQLNGRHSHNRTICSVATHNIVFFFSAHTHFQLLSPSRAMYKIKTHTLKHTHTHTNARHTIHGFTVRHRGLSVRERNVRTKRTNATNDGRPTDRPYERTNDKQNKCYDRVRAVSEHFKCSHFVVRCHLVTIGAYGAHSHRFEKEISFPFLWHCSFNAHCFSSPYCAFHRFDCMLHARERSSTTKEIFNAIVGIPSSYQIDDACVLCSENSIPVAAALWPHTDLSSMCWPHRATTQYGKVTERDQHDSHTSWRILSYEIMTDGRMSGSISSSRELTLSRGKVKNTRF